VRLIGPAETGALPNQEFLSRARDEGWLDLVTERIPQREALQIARSSNSLLLLQPQSTTQVPAKVFQYIQIGRPILAFIQPNSPAERLLERSGVPYRCVYPGSTPEAIDETVASFFDLPSTAVAPNLGSRSSLTPRIRRGCWMVSSVPCTAGPQAPSPDFLLAADKLVPRSEESYQQFAIMNRLHEASRICIQNTIRRLTGKHG